MSPSDDSLPLLVTLGLDPASFVRLDGLRSRYFPPDRNIVPAHVSLFHQLPGHEAPAIRDALAEAASTTGPIPLSFTGPFRLGRGVGIRVDAPGLGAIHARLSRAFDTWLTPQDRQPFRPHVTVMNKADREAVLVAFDELRAGWTPWTGSGVSLLLWRYLGGPWAPVDRFDFATGSGPAGP